MPKKEKKVVVQYPWCAVVERHDEDWNKPVFDMWVWNLYKLKWVRMSQHGSGFGELHYADKAAKEQSDEIQRMLDNNKNPPSNLK